MDQPVDYETINDLQGILEYIDQVDGFRDCSLAQMSYDSAFGIFSVGIEEVLENDNWPQESNGDIWYLKFGNIRSLKFDVDAPTGLWVNDMYVDDGGNFVIETNQGYITVAAGVIELSVPPDAENSSVSSNHNFEPLSPKQIFNDFKSAFLNKKPADNSASTNGDAQQQPAQQPVQQPATTPVQPAAPVAQPTMPAQQPMPQPMQPAAPQPAPVADVAPVPVQNPAPIPSDQNSPQQPIITG